VGTEQVVQRRWWRGSPWRLVVAGLVVSLAGLWGVVGRRASVEPARLGSEPARRTPAARTAGLVDGPPAVRLEALEAPAPAPTESPRNPFRFQAAPAPAPPLVAPRRAPTIAPGVDDASGGRGVAAPGGPAPPAPIPLKFIGVVEAPGVGKIAALSDGKFVYHGREGDIVDGRYRIVKIGVESIVVEYVDGRGRQTIRLTG
jgi:hypothetical protein